MKTGGFVFLAVMALAACNNSATTEEVQKIKDLAAADSLKAVQAGQNDSLMTSYLNDLNEIQDNLDRIKQREKIISMRSPEMNSTDKQNVVAEVKELDDWIIANDKKMNRLESRLWRADKKNDKLQTLVTHLTEEMTEKDEEIAVLQAKLGRADDSIRMLTVTLDDSIKVIKTQRAQIGVLNMVYYVTGTEKQLEDKGVIDKEGGFVGLGRVAELTPGANSMVFMKANLNSLKGINLHGKFRRFITVHPDNAYEIISNSKSDSIAIRMPATFWSESKYLVVATK